MKSNRVICFYKKKNPFAFEKNGPCEFLYGLDYLQNKLPAQAFFSNDYQWYHSPLKILEKIIARKTITGIHFQAFLNNKNKIKKNDILFTINDGLSFGLLFYKLIKKLDNKIVVLIQGLHDRYQYFKKNKLLVIFYQKLLSKADLILTLSQYEKNLLVKFFKIAPEKISVFYFGADLKYWQKNKNNYKPKNGDFVLTLGNDMHRDYNLLINHYDLKIPLKFVTKILTPIQLKKIGKNPFLQSYPDISNQKLRRLYQQAKFIIVPLKNTLATSGLSVTLQAMAMGKPVLLAQAPALKELFQDKKHVLYYKMGSPQSFEQKIQELNRNKKLREVLAKNGRKLIVEKFNARNTGKSLLQICRSLMK